MRPKIVPRKILPPTQHQLDLRARNAIKRGLRTKINEARADGDGITLTEREIWLISLNPLEKEYIRYAQNDSPKGESVQGVRRRGRHPLHSLNMIPPGGAVC